MLRVGVQNMQSLVGEKGLCYVDWGSFMTPLAYAALLFTASVYVLLESWSALQG